ncbi:hypothetical protein SAMD00019534_102720 [Acytostelium subglobosum LB1]|uniref:hypothetical protein n=1 Tax=Acytostelium subglobosum LB1 TaxID=1410327 RepID=UPI000644E529|nr:hypothetical protein SAMD00019534_102720 [Acytostelium subglobosum LB1]GAM27097.1 hypothetical protein SAMD00019534_102720 [Acytostelium subglobosum LB1]|eukprot:XP_012749977.1 hypothetical protein SAMD00019534_102720 [Acytostelium subglobosum LB1]
MKIDKIEEAIGHFILATRYDPFLAIGYFMRGVCHYILGNNNHSIVDYDESISRLRGHEFIDYSQIGLNYRLLLTEILFNKSLSLGSAGASVATMASKCKVMPADTTYKEQLALLVQCKMPGVRMPSLELLFKPPNVSDKPPPIPEQLPPVFMYSTTTSTSPRAQSPSSSTPTSPRAMSPTPTTSSPPYTLRNPSNSSSPDTSRSPQNTQPQRERATSPVTIINKPPPPPPMLIKKLPSRPFSMLNKEVLTTMRCYYQDRRMIQIPVECTMHVLRSKIEAKFGPGIVSGGGFTIRCRDPSSYEMFELQTQEDLDWIRENGINDLFINRPGETNMFESSYEDYNVMSPEEDRRANTLTPTPSPRTPTTPTSTSPISPRQLMSQLSKSAQINPSPPIVTPMRHRGQTAPSQKTPPPPLPRKPSMVSNSTSGTSSSSSSSSPIKLCQSPSGERFYLNTQTGEVSWSPPPV